MYFVYIIKSKKTGGLYKGFTKNLNQRLKKHNSRGTKSTIHGIPWKMIYFESYETYREARNRELYFKSAAGRRWIKYTVLSTPPPD